MPTGHLFDIQYQLYNIQTRGNAMKKEITIREFADELVERLNADKTVDCCKQELLNLAAIVKDKLADHLISVEWKS
ncbi:MAG: hypothetical protein DRZ90_00720 [Spirochaetes bacterium]|nr:MAG: hypothetical protein DRZ90_00720 [Spirochaetota bacterium]